MDRRLPRIANLLQEQLTQLTAVSAMVQEAARNLSKYRPRDALRNLMLQLFHVDAVEFDPDDMEEVVTDCFWDWCTAQKSEGHGLEAQTLTWRLLCREAVLEQQRIMCMEAMSWVTIVRDESRESHAHKQRNLDSFLFDYEQNLAVWRNMQRTGVRFWDPAGPEDMQRAVPTVLVEAMQATVADMQRSLDQLELKWQRDCQPFVGLGFDCLRDDVSQFKAWIEQQLR